MIYTVTLNPAIDVILKLNESYRVGKINRANSESFSIGGKGINVTRVLKELKRESVALGIVGGATGHAIEEYLKEANIKADFAHVKGSTRINVKVHYQGATLEETQINGPGPDIGKEDVMSLAKKLAKIKKEDVVIVSGGIPKTLSINLYDSFIKYISSRDVYLVVDSFGTPLLKVLRYKPFLVTLNEEELADTLYSQIKTEDDCIKGAKRLLKMGAKNVIILRGANGAIFINDEMIIKAKPPKGEVKNTNGAGDSLLAGFTDEYLKTGSFDLAIKKGVLVSCATVFSDHLATEKSIADIIKQTK